MFCEGGLGDPALVYTFATGGCVVACASIRDVGGAAGGLGGLAGLRDRRFIYLSRDGVAVGRVLLLAAWRDSAGRSLGRAHIYSSAGVHFLMSACHERA